jgi:hypothetical protein
MRLGLLLKHFSRLDGEREPWRVMHPLKKVLLLVTCPRIPLATILSPGARTISISRGGFSDFHHGIPCERWLRHLFNRVDPALFGRCFEAGSRPCGPIATRSSPSPARRRAAPMIAAKASRCCIRPAPMRPRRGLSSGGSGKDHRSTPIPELLDHVAERK